MKLETIEVQHIWTGEVRVLKVLSFTEKDIVVQWPLAGGYTLTLATNVLQANSAAARRKGFASVWQAKDIESLRRIISEHYHPKTSVFKKPAMKKAPFYSMWSGKKVKG